MESTLKTLAVSTTQPDPDVIDQAVEALRNGQLVVIPTETVYGVAAAASDPEAVAKIYAAKGRADGKPLALFASDVDTIARSCTFLGDIGQRLAERFCPGPITLVLPTDNGTVGFRIPDHPVALALVQSFGDFLAVTSANQSGEPDAVTAGDAEAALGHSVEIILDAGPAEGQIPSTVIQITREGKWSILRQGAITEQAIREAIS